MKYLWHLPPPTHRMGCGAAVQTRGLGSLRCWRVAAGLCQGSGGPRLVPGSPRLGFWGGVDAPAPCIRNAGPAPGLLPLLPLRPGLSLGPGVQQPLPPCWGLTSSLPPGLLSAPPSARTAGTGVFNQTVALCSTWATLGHSAPHRDSHLTRLGHTGRREPPLFSEPRPA